MKRLIILLAAVCTVAGAAAQEQKPSKKTDWAQFYRYEQANADLAATGKRVDAVFMGNSITDHWYRFDPDFFEKNNFAGRGISGQTTSEMLVRFRRDVLELNPRVVLIMAGTNDIARNNGDITLENALGNVASMCELAKAHKIKVIICSIPPAATFRWRPGSTPAQTIIEYNAMLRSYAEANAIPYLDYWTALADERNGIPAKWCNDEVHPTLRGYIEVFEPLALEAVNKVLKTKKNYISPLPAE